MPLEPGSRLGPYEVQSVLGAGGMGQVFKARDTRLDRTVAIKVLPEYIANLSGAKARFEREAQLLSKLSHPHICSVFDVGQQDGVDYLVMEHLEGETLEARLQKGPLPLDQALKTAIDIANALVAAHRSGITHRDLKPGNVMLTKTGAKLLDFGLAKTQPVAVSFTTQSDAPTRVPAVTGEGTILGTLQYMSPEQIEGKDADARTDIFAFGALLYEMVTGTKAFQGKSQASLLAVILEHEPRPMSALQSMTPPTLEHLVRRCLAKDTEQRWQSAQDIVHELKWILDVGFGAGPSGVTPQPSRKPWAWIVATAVCLLAAVSVFVVYFRSTMPPQALRYAIPLPKDGQSEGLFVEFHISPDGRSIAASGVLGQTTGIFVRELDSWEFRLLPGIPPGDFFWSPDSRYIGFFDDQKLKKVPAKGGPAEDICAVPSGFFQGSGSWGRNDVIVFAPAAGGSLLAVPAAGGEPRKVTTAGSGVSHEYPVFLPDGQHFLYTNKGDSIPGIYLASLDNPAGQRLLGDQSSVQFAPAAPGGQHAHLLFAREGKLMAQAFDPNALALEGDAFVVAERALFADNGAIAVSVSYNGILTYLGGSSRETDSRLAWFDRSGKRLATEGPAGPISPAALSPDEKTTVVLRRRPGSVVGDLLLLDLTRGGLETRFTFDNAAYSGGNLIWSPDGGRIAFSSTASGPADLYVKDIRTSGSAEHLFRNGNLKMLTDWSKDGFLLYTEIDPKTRADLWYLRMDGSVEGNAKPVSFLQTEFDESYGQISPDGRWIAYVSNESGKDYQVYVRPFPSGPGKWKVSAGPDALQPRWSQDGTELFYVSGPAGKGTLMSARVIAPTRSASTVQVLEVGPAKPLFEVRVNQFHPMFGTFFYSVSRDGQRFLIDYVEADSEPVLNVVVNWEQALKSTP